MKRILGSLLLVSVMFSSFSYAQPMDFVHPMGFDGSEKQKQAAVDYITKQVKKQYCDDGLDMCQDFMLRMMEDENLSAFKRLTKADNKSILDRVIKDYCQGIGLCDYVTIEMMYNENLKASKKKLEW